jgi:hypothetical protein
MMASRKPGGLDMVVLICLRLSMLIGVLFLAILGGDQVLSGVLKCCRNSPEEVVTGWVVCDDCARLSLAGTLDS